jgi:hypothetical protein
MGNFESGAQTLYYGLGIISMLGGAVAAYVKRLQSWAGHQKKTLTEYKLHVGLEGILERPEAGNH